MKLYQRKVGLAPKPMADALVRRQKSAHRHRRPCKEREIVVMLPQAQELLGLPEARGGKEEAPLEDLSRAGPYQHPDFRLLASTTVKISIV